MIALAESGEFVQRILRYAEHGEPVGGQAGEIIAKIAGFGGATRGHRRRVEVQDDVRATQCGKRDGTAGVGGEREVRGRLPGFEPCGNGGGCELGCGDR